MIIKKAIYSTITSLAISSACYAAPIAKIFKFATLGALTSGVQGNNLRNLNIEETRCTSKISIHVEDHSDYDDQYNIMHLVVRDDNDDEIFFWFNNLNIPEEGSISVSAKIDAVFEAYLHAGSYSIDGFSEKKAEFKIFQDGKLLTRSSDFVSQIEVCNTSLAPTPPPAEEEEPPSPATAPAPVTAPAPASAPTQPPAPAENGH